MHDLPGFFLLLCCWCADRRTPEEKAYDEAEQERKRTARALANAENPHNASVTPGPQPGPSRFQPWREDPEPKTVANS